MQTNSIFEKAKPNKSNRVIIDNAKYVYNSGAIVNWNSSMSWVKITRAGQETIFMQGHEADNWIDELEKLGNRYHSLSPDVLALHMAKDYIDCLWQ